VPQGDNRDVVSPKTPPTTHSREESRQYSASIRGARGWCSTSGTLTPVIFTREMSPKNDRLRKPTALISKGPKVL